MRYPVYTRSPEWADSPWSGATGIKLSSAMPTTQRLCVSIILMPFYVFRLCECKRAAKSGFPVISAGNRCWKKLGFRRNPCWNFQQCWKPTFFCSFMSVKFNHFFNTDRCSVTRRWNLFFQLFVSPVATIFFVSVVTGDIKNRPARIARIPAGVVTIWAYNVHIVTIQWSLGRPVKGYELTVWASTGLSVSILWSLYGHTMVIISPESGQKESGSRTKQEPLYQLVSSCGCKIKLERWEFVNRRWLGYLPSLAPSLKQPRTIQTHIQYPV